MIVGGCQPDDLAKSGSSSAPGLTTKSVATVTQTTSSAQRPAPEATASAKLRPKFPPMRSDAEIQQLAAAECKRTHADKPAFLVEFSAPWCPDCAVLNKLKKDPELARELSHWASLRINIGEFDQNKAFLTSFDVDAIASWVALSPKDCQAPITKWPRVGRRLVEPASGPAERSSVRKLTIWLKRMRGKVSL